MAWQIDLAINAVIAVAHLGPFALIVSGLAIVAFACFRLRKTHARLPLGPAIVDGEKALRTAEQLFRTAFENAPIGLALVGLDGRFMRVNRSLCEIAGRDEADLLERTFQEITHPDDLDADL